MPKLLSCRRNHVTGIRYEDMSTGEEHLLNLDGIFVQIGLLQTHHG